MQRTDDQLLWYLAGVFDGEGCVTAGVNKNGSARIACKVAMTDLATVQMFQDRFPAPMQKERPRTEKYSTLYRWAVTGVQSIPFLEAMSERCGLKGKAINLALKYFRGNQIKLSIEDRLERVELLKAIRATIARTNATPIPEENIRIYLSKALRGRPRPVVDADGNKFASRTAAAQHYGTTSQCISSAITHDSVCCGTKWREAA